MSTQRILLNMAITLSLLVFVMPAYGSSKSDLAKTKKEITQIQKKKEKIEQEQAALSLELAALQRVLVKAAAKVQKGEAALSVAESRLRVTSKKLAKKKREMKKRKKYLASLLQASLSLSRTPMEAIVLMPGDSKKTMKAARALSMISDNIKQEAELIRLELEALEELNKKIAAQRNILIKRQKILNKEQKNISAQLAKRSRLQEKLKDDSRIAAKKIEELARKAGNLENLVKTLKEAAHPKPSGKKISMPKSIPKGRKGKMRSFRAAKGKIRPPLAGHIIKNYGKAAKKNETQKGITIQARPSARVTAPYDGEVVFSGRFLNYGKMVILRHSDNFHTLLAGLADIDVRAGEFLLEGEPIGAMGDSSLRAKLYLELRKNNRPINPAPWIRY